MSSHVIIDNGSSDDEGDEREERSAREEKKDDGTDLPILFWDEKTTPANPEDNPDFAALQSLIYDETTPEERAVNFKNQGNDALKTAMATKKKKFYLREAITCYDKALAQGPADKALLSQILGNKAHVNLMLGNYNKALSDSMAAIKEDGTNVKAHYRGARAAMFLDKYEESGALCTRGLELDPENTDISKILKVVEEKRRVKEEKDVADEQRRQADRLPWVALAGEVLKRGYTMGTCLYSMPGTARRPNVDEEGIMHWPVLLLYGESSQSDYIQDFAESHTFAAHLDVMYGEGAPPLEWDVRGEYTRARVELYFRRHAVRPLAEEGALIDALATEDGQAATAAAAGGGAAAGVGGKKAKWVRVKEEETLAQVLKAEGHVLPGLPVFYVVARDTQFRADFRSGEWDPNTN